MTRSTPDQLRSFGRRKGRKLRTHAQELVEGLLPKIGLRLEALGMSDFLPNPQSPIPNPLTLEIGFGGGEHLSHMASLHPEVSFIGVEPYLNGISGLLKDIEQKHLDNIRIYTDDVRDLLAALPDAVFDRVYILYPDPWPKARHHKRRLIQKPLLDLLARTMKPGAELRIATDWDDYATWILERLLLHPDFTWLAEKASDFNSPWEEWIPTRYEQKARREGRGSMYLRFRHCES